MSMQLGFYFDASACTGCKTCVIACKDRHDHPVGVNFRRVMHHEGGRWEPHPARPGVWTPQVYAYSISVSCNHCAAPVCMEVCPAGAIRKNEHGLVLVDQELCLGCRLCKSCPYDAPQFNEKRGVMTLCDGCAGDAQPACVAACPQRALAFGDIGALKTKHGAVSGIEPLPDPRLTLPSLVITPHRHSPLSRDPS